MCGHLAFGIVCVGASALSGCLASRQGGILFPTQSEMGVVSITDGTKGTVGTRYSTALSWASVSPSPTTPVDVGIGYQVDVISEEPAGKTHGEPPKPKTSHGPIVEASCRLQGSEHWRHWVGARLELPLVEDDSQTRVGVGAALRTSLEIFAAGSGSNMIGAFGLGAYVEAGMRKVPHEPQAFVVSSGLTLRLPLAAVN